MSASSSIEWTDATFNPWSGCAKVSEACRNCYAERDTKRYGLALWGVNAERQFRAEAYWKQPVKWNRDAERAGERRRVFCASLADVFEVHAVEATNAKMNDARGRLWELIAATPMLDWLLLTKRPENILACVPLRWTIAGESSGGALGRAPANIWLGCTAESQEHAEERVPLLLAAKHALGVRIAFVSHEPAGGPVDFTRLGDGGEIGATFDALRGGMTGGLPSDMGGTRLDWIITGGESGPGARPYDVAWARQIVAQGRAAGVPVFVKQFGAVVHDRNDVGFLGDEKEEISPGVWQRVDAQQHQGALVRIRLKDRKGGDPNEWPHDLRVREFPTVPT